MTVGILNDSKIKKLFNSQEISSDIPLDEDQIQPASLDLRLGDVAWRVRASFLPGEESSVSDKLKQFASYKMNLSSGAVLETGCIYIVPLLESLRLPKDIEASTNPKSSTGRLDVFTRVITDYSGQFDVIKKGYKGPLYLEISPRTFPVFVRKKYRLSQIRFRQGNATLSEEELWNLHKQEKLVSITNSETNAHGSSITTGLFGKDIEQDDVIHIDEELSQFRKHEKNVVLRTPVISSRGIAISVDLIGDKKGRPIIGYRGKRHADVIDIGKKGILDHLDFWEPIYRSGSNIVLDPDQFYILVSREAISVPPHTAAEMMPFDPLVGEFRVHYAGFFDPGFGHETADGKGARAVLEVRSHEVPFVLEHTQIVGWLAYEHMMENPKTLYGNIQSSNYQKQGLKLSKHFK